MENYTAYTIIPDLKLIITYFEGTVTFNDVIKLNMQFISDKLYDSTFNILMDFRNSTALAYRMDLKEYFEFFKKNISLSKRIRNGIMYRTANQKFIISMYIPIAKLMKIDAKEFETLEKYFTWMEFTAEEQDLIRGKLNSIKNPPV